tara:strand:+ start:567 stop:875 length:309 start_codon:yes stop_codon:yes gene_type:complete
VLTGHVQYIFLSLVHGLSEVLLDTNGTTERPGAIFIEFLSIFFYLLVFYLLCFIFMYIYLVFLLDLSIERVSEALSNKELGYFVEKAEVGDGVRIYTHCAAQ